MKRALALALLTGLGSVVSVRAEPGDALRVRLAPLGTSSDAQRVEALARVRGELTAAGFRVEEGAAAVDAQADAAIARMAAGDADAAVVLVQSEPAAAEGAPTGVVFWVYEPWQQATTRVAVAPGAVEPSLAIKRGAVQAVEVLRAALERDAAAAAVDSEAPAADATPADEGLAGSTTGPADEVEGRAPIAHIGAGIGLWSGFDGLGSVLSPLARVSVVLPVLGAGADAALELRASAGGFGQHADFSAPEGSVRVRQTLLGAELVLRGWPHALVQPLLSAGGGAYGIAVEGDAVAPFASRSPAAWSGVLGAGGGVWLALLRHLAASLEAQLLLSTAPSEIRIAERVEALAGEPMLLISAQLMGAL